MVGVIALKKRQFFNPRFFYDQKNALAGRISAIVKNEYLRVKPKDLNKVTKRGVESVIIYN